MLADEQTILTVVVQANYFCFRMSREEASGIMRAWYHARELVRTRAEGWEAAKQWLSYGTLAGNVVNLPGTPEVGLDLCVRVVGNEHIVGMYTQEIQPSAAERAAAAMEKMARDHGHGEEWREDAE